MASFGSDSRPIIGRGPSLVARSLVLIALSVALMVGDQRYDYLQQLRSIMSSSVYPLQWLVDAPFRATRWMGESVTDRSELRSENTRLSQELRDAQVDLQKLAALTEENRRLRELGDASDDVAKQRLVAQIMRVNVDDPLRHRVLLNKGQKDGVFKSQPILDAHGIFGQITQVGRYTSEAILISDPAHAIPVRVGRSGLRTIAEGTGNLNKLNLPFLTGEADVKVGDLLVASGLGGVFPAGYPVGTITRVERDPAQTFALVEAKPMAKLDSDYEVVLIWYKPPAVEPAIAPAATPGTVTVTPEQLEAATKTSGTITRQTEQSSPQTSSQSSSQSAPQTSPQPAQP
ncbi:MAG: rod shape-determining protein MreC [Steroidobacteraceae bacterium]